MEYRAVSSSTVAAVAYDADTMTLGVQFHNGTEYQYLQVPLHVYEGLLGAGSPGTYFNQFVKAAGYAYVRVR